MSPVSRYEHELPQSASSSKPRASASERRPRDRLPCEWPLEESARKTIEVELVDWHREQKLAEWPVELHELQQSCCWPSSSDRQAEQRPHELPGDEHALRLLAAAAAAAPLSRWLRRSGGALIKLLADERAERTV